MYYNTFIFAEDEVVAAAAGAQDSVASIRKESPLLPGGHHKKKIDTSIKKTCCCICSGCTTVFIIKACLLMWVGYHLTSKADNEDSWHKGSITPPEFPRMMGCGSCMPGNKTDEQIKKCVSPCFHLDYVLEWENFAKTHPWKLVYFPSRKGPQGEPPVNISAWWLPGDTSRLPPGAISPRIVVVHGLASNNNHCGVQATCYLLRTMGFSCLTPSVRDYGLSGQSTHPSWISWGYDYQMDVLGAWDYAVQDPDGVLGGALSESQVGIQGFSRGALDVANAFALEDRIPAAWVDSAPYTSLYGMVDAFVRPYAGFLTDAVVKPVWESAYMFTGGKVDTFLPWDLLSNASKDCSGKKPRPLQITQDMEDTMVPINEGLTAIKRLSSNNCYDVTAYNPPANCFGDKHHTYMWVFPDDARTRLCNFWSKVFSRDVKLCALDKLTKLQKVSTLDSQFLPDPPQFTV